MTNRAFMTAKHCVQAYVNSPSQVTGFMHPWAAAADAIWVHPSKDVAIVELSVAFPLYDSSFTRPFYTGSDASLNNRTLTLSGYGVTTNCSGGGPFSLRKASMTATDDGISGQVITYPNSLGQIGHLGDSGGPLLDGSSLTTSPLAGIQTDCGGYSCPGTPPRVCWYDTAEGWSLWAFLVLWNIPRF